MTQFCLKTWQFRHQLIQKIYVLYIIKCSNWIFWHQNYMITRLKHQNIVNMKISGTEKVCLKFLRFWGYFLNWDISATKKRYERKFCHFEELKSWIFKNLFIFSNNKITKTIKIVFKEIHFLYFSRFFWLEFFYDNLIKFTWYWVFQMKYIPTAQNIHCSIRTSYKKSILRT